MLHRALFQTQASFSIGRTAKDLFRNLATNAIVLGLIAGSLWRVTGLGLHPIAGTMLDMLADASVPTALVALGISLAGSSLKGSWGGMFALIAIKMVLMPVAVFALARYAVTLPPLWVALAFPGAHVRTADIFAAPDIDAMVQDGASADWNADSDHGR